MLLHTCPGTHENQGTMTMVAILQGKSPAVPMASPYLTGWTQPVFAPGLERAGRHMMPWLSNLVCHWGWQGGKQAFGKCLH